jgi:hypothetical protein
MNASRIAALVVGLGVCVAAVALVAPGGNAPRPAGEDTREHAQAPEGPKLAPPIALKDMAGKAWELASLRDKRAALVVFWASW